MALMGVTALDFHQAAAREAARYGADPWVFVRELLQNARDAGANRVFISTCVDDDIEEVAVADNGDGMTHKHAQRFLFTLFASSKDAADRMAGVFGVGFWSILAFEPDVIVLRSRAAGETRGWEVTLDGRLENIGSRSVTGPVGTSVTLSRGRVGREGTLAASVWDAVRRDARHLRCRDYPEQLIEVIVDGRRATEPLRAGGPGVFFRGPGMRGVVTLHEEPSVTLLAHGLRVRTAATAEDLLFGPRQGAGADMPMPQVGLWPRAVVDSDRLAVLMARGDVAQDRELTRVVRRIEDETRRLYTSELDRLAPRTALRRRFESARVAWDRHRLVWLAGVLGFAVLALLLLDIPAWAPKSRSPSLAAGPALQPQNPQPYMDLSAGYLGPALDTMTERQTAPDLRYFPEQARPALAAFKVIGLDEVGRPVPATGDLRPARPLDQVVGDPLEIDVVIRSSGGMMRVPVPTGHLVDPASVLVDGRATTLWYTAAGEPVIRPPVAAEGRLTYRTVQALDVQELAAGGWPSLPEEIADRLAGLRALEPSQRVAGGTDVVKEMISTRFDLETYEILRQARSRGDSLMASVLQARGGDCDVVNSVLATVLDAVGLRARLAVGWIGYQGTLLPGYHAWVEVDLGGGHWVAVDASVAPANAIGGIGEVRSDGSPPSPQNDQNVVPVKESTALPASWAPAGAACVVFGLAGVLAMVWKRRFRRTFCAGEDADPGPIVESILRDREAWRSFPAARRRPLVPQIGSGRCSLLQLERAAAAGRFFAARQPGPIVDQVRTAGGLVVDASSRAGRAAMSALGAVDLDRWRRLASSAGATGELAQRVALVLGSVGVDVEILEVAGLTEPAESLRVPGDSRTQVLVDREGREWVSAVEGLSSRPQEAVFRAADLVVRSLSVAGNEGSRALGDLAFGAVLEVLEPVL